jgi:transketolase
MTACMQLALRLGSPVYLRMGKSDCGDVHKAPLALQPGELLQVRAGSGHLAMLATGSMVTTALAVTARGLNAEVWSAPCIKPLSNAVLNAIAARVEAIITLEEHSTIGGLGSCVSELLTKAGANPVLRIGIEDRFSSYCGSWDYLLQEHGLDANSVSQKVTAFVRTLSVKMSV